MRENKKICFILPTLHAGGIENYTLRFLKSVIDKFSVTIICLHPGRGDLYMAFKQLGVQVIYKRIGYLNPLTLSQLYRFFKRSAFETLVDFTGNFGGVRMWVAKLAGIGNRIVFYRRSNDGFTKNIWKDAYNRFENRMVFFYATKIFSNSRHAFTYFFSNEYAHDKRFKVIPNGVDISSFHNNDKRAMRERFGISSESFVIGHVGRFDPAKNHSTIFKVAKKMFAKFEDVVFVFCGKGTNSAEFMDEVGGTGFADRIIALGLQADVNAVLGAMDVFYFPSIAEGQPNALIEAMLANLPIIASNIAPIKESTPVQAHPFLIEPLQVDDAIIALTQVKNEPTKIERRYKEWARGQFAQVNNFKLFENEL